MSGSCLVSYAVYTWCTPYSVPRRHPDGEPSNLSFFIPSHPQLLPPPLPPHKLTNVYQGLSINIMKATRHQGTDQPSIPLNISPMSLTPSFFLCLAARLAFMFASTCSPTRVFSSVDDIPSAAASNFLLLVFP